ncbi:GNAT family N-acetyltransferase [Bacillus sp. H-16]|uniref:GNAT family N-acetyltransferase n=2 Tax=Bacillaceae TaxID=186817 RepID=A0A3M7TTK5_9BACI|nr:GNAT family N-acetyltransferase [Alteribacter salitolerans]MBM7095512.1 GNAT family N-acetyltransferase [Alteribacter salitolerans]RNA68082.1 GNAT family N-acetyltransferase [Alteribacter keqinensis]
MERITNEHRKELEDFFSAYWGDDRMVYSHGVYQCSELEGFIAHDGESIVGAVTFYDHKEENVREVISLDSLIERNGVGGNLMELVENDAITRGLEELCLVTTNDNIHALGFYQKRGYKLVEIRQDAVEKCRKIKPQIPLTGTNDIEIRDEWVMKKPVQTQS